MTGDGRTRPRTKREHLADLLGYAEARKAGDKRPVLLYFHWPHGDPTHGKRTTETCTRVLEQETAARWALFFRPIRIEMEQSEVTLARELGAGDGPSFAVLAPDMSVRARFVAPRSTAKLVKQWRAILEQRPEFASQLESRIAAQKKQLDAAKVLAKEGRTKHALWMVKRIRDSDVRVDPVWDQAFAYAARLEQELRAAKK